MDVSTIQRLLNENGFPCGQVDGVIGPRTRSAVGRFQLAYNGPNPWLEVDERPGPKTQAALAQLPRLSPHFVVAELRSRGDGTCYVRRELLAALEVTRAHIGRPIPVRSAYRDPAHNDAVGGAGKSQHPEGTAVDVPASLGLRVATAQALGVWSGIGDRNGVVLHLDVRHVVPATNWTRSTPRDPARWNY